MLKVRLQRVGRRNDPSFRVVVTDSTRGPKSGKYIEMLGSYNPRQKSVVLNGDRIKYWMSVGAKVTGTMHNLLIKEKITSGKKVNVLPKKSPIVQVASKESDKETAVSEDNETLKHGYPK
ncbi:30S ribosomal protein S16, partial [Patescibacteria group bacterium]|nr:30S ribosomal protein S16 [Patescibacteria group bacterium]